MTMGFEHRSDSQQMDYRNDRKLRCDHCGGTGRAWRYLNETTREYIGPCDECNGTGRRAG